jgi:hypothetical protein
MRRLKFIRSDINSCPDLFSVNDVLVKHPLTFHDVVPDRNFIYVEDWYGIDILLEHWIKI